MSFPMTMPKKGQDIKHYIYYVAPSPRSENSLVMSKGLENEVPDVFWCRVVGA